MVNFKPFLALFIIALMTLVHGAGLKNYVLCIEQSGEFNIEFSVDSHCCNPSDTHEAEFSSKDECEPGHQDYQIVQIDDLNKISSVKLIPNTYNTLVLYTLAYQPILNFEKIPQSSDNTPLNSIRFLKSTVLLI